MEQEFAAQKEKIDALLNAPLDDTAFLWDETARKYAVKMEKIRRLLTQNDVEERIKKSVLCNLDAFLTRCATPEYHIALVGAIKAGKSTLINAIIGNDLASTEVTPETASLTKFRRAEEDYVEVSFYTAEEWNSLWKSAEESRAKVFVEEYNALNADQEKGNWLGQDNQKTVCSTREELKTEIARWTSSKSPTHYFVKEVIVGLKDFDLPDGVVMVDTPGLDDVVEYRSNITRDYISRANAVLVCVRSDALTGGELQTILRVFQNARGDAEKVYVIATQIDTLNEPQKDWAKQNEEWLKYLKEQGCYGSRDLAQQKLIPISAWLYSALQSYKENKISEEERAFFALESVLLKYMIRIKNLPEKFHEVEESTNISLLKTKLQSEIISKYKKRMIDDICVAYEQNKEDIGEQLRRLRDEQQEIIDTSNKGLDEIRKKKEEYEEKVKAAEEEKKSLEQLVSSVKFATTKRAEELIAAIKALSEKQVKTR